MKKSALVLVFLLLPSLAYGAGFAKQSIFLSRTDVTEGETVLLYATVSNESQTKFDGGLAFYDGETKIGAVPVVLAGGEAQTSSVSWKPAAGTRTVTAKLAAKDGSGTETLSEKFAIKAKPQPNNAQNQVAAVESSQSIQDSITGTVPQAAPVVEPVFSTLDSVRESIADLADTQIAQTKPKISGSVLGTESPSADGTTPDPQGWMWNIVYTIYFYILTVVRFVVGSAAVFYPLVAVAFLYFLYKMFRRFARPSY